MTLDEAIKHAEEVANEEDKLCKRYDDASGYTRSHNEEIRTSDAKKCEKCAEEHRQLAEWLKDYKRLLEEQRGNDAISRKKVIDTIYCECSCENLDIDFAKVLLLQRAIKALPPVTPKSETVTEFADRCRECGAKYGKLLKQKSGMWIPVSERMPKEFADVLCSTDSDEIFIAKYLGKMNDGTDCFDDDDGMMWEGDVIAWMPLPRPYKGASGGGDNDQGTMR